MDGTRDPYFDQVSPSSGHECLCPGNVKPPTSSTRCVQGPPRVQQRLPGAQVTAPRASLPGLRSLSDTHSPAKTQPGGALLAALARSHPNSPRSPSLYDPHPGTRDTAGACVAPRRVSPKPASTFHSFMLAFTEPQTGRTSGECLFSKHVALYYFPPGSHWPPTHSP